MRQHKKAEPSIHSSTAEYLTYVASIGDTTQNVEVRYEEATIKKYLIVQTEGNRTVEREVSSDYN